VDPTSEVQSNLISDRSVAASLNFHNGIANTVMVDILQNIDREAVREQIRMNQQEGQQALNTLTESKRLTAGVVFKSGKAWLGPEVLQEQINRKRKKDEKEKEQLERLKAEQEKKKRAFEKAWGEVTNLPSSRWSVQQLWALVSYKKRKTDKWPQLKTRAQLLEVWEQIKDRLVSPPQSPIRAECNEEDENEE
jgi:hypothetical protein